MAWTKDFHPLPIGEYAKGYAAGYQTALAAAHDVAMKLGGDRVESERPSRIGARDKEARVAAAIHAQHVRAASIAKAIAKLAADGPKAERA